jgi:hypothetical protein
MIIGKCTFVTKMIHVLLQVCFGFSIVNFIWQLINMVIEIQQLSDLILIGGVEFRIQILPPMDIGLVVISWMAIILYSQFDYFNDSLAVSMLEPIV